MTKLAILCANKLDTFIKPLIPYFNKEFDTKLFIIKRKEDIKEAIQYGDVLWFEWANEVAILGSREFETQFKPVLVRLHSYEALAYYPTQLNFSNIDKLIFVAPHIKNIVKQYIPNLDKLVDTEVVYNGLDVNQPVIGKAGYNIAFVAHISHKKNFPLALQIINELVNIDSKYVLHVAGDFQELREKVYADFYIKENKLENNVKFYGWVDNMDKWWQNKNYILSTSIHESFGYSIAEGMVRGIKPVINAFYGASDIFLSDTVFYTVKEAVKMITETHYKAKLYHNYIKEFYDRGKQAQEFINILKILENRY